MCMTRTIDIAPSPDCAKVRHATVGAGKAELSMHSHCCILATRSTKESVPEQKLNLLMFEANAMSSPALQQ